MLGLLGTLVAPCITTSHTYSQTPDQTTHGSALQDSKQLHFKPAYQLPCPDYASQVARLKRALDQLDIYIECLDMFDIKHDTNLKPLFPTLEALHEKFPFTNQDWVRFTSGPTQAPVTSYLEFAREITEYELNLLGTGQSAFDKLLEKEIIGKILLKHPELGEAPQDESYTRLLVSFFGPILPRDLDGLKFINATIAKTSEECISDHVVQYDSSECTVKIDSRTTRMGIAMALCHQLGHVYGDRILRQANPQHLSEEQKSYLGEAIACIWEKHLIAKFTESMPNIAQELTMLHEILWASKLSVGKSFAMNVLAKNRDRLPPTLEYLESGILDSSSEALLEALSHVEASVLMSQFDRSRLINIPLNLHHERTITSQESLTIFLIEPPMKSECEPQIRKYAENVRKELEAYLGMLYR